MLLAEAGSRGLDAETLGARLGLARAVLRQRLASAQEAVPLGGEPESWIDAGAFRSLAQEALSPLTDGNFLS